MNDRSFRRRDLLGWSLAASSGLAPMGAWAAAEPPPETTRIRLSRYPFDVACVAPMWVAEELLRAEGFSNVEYVPFAGSLDGLVSGKQDLILYDSPGLVLALDEGKPVVVLGGIHGGCYELFGTDRVRSVLDLRGRTVAVSTTGRQAFVAAMASYVGLDPRKDIFCCMVVAHRAFARRHPVATKRALRALIKATDICAAEPERVTRQLVARGYLKDYDYSLQAIRELCAQREVERGRA